MVQWQWFRILATEFAWRYHICGTTSVAPHLCLLVSDNADDVYYSSDNADNVYYISGDAEGLYYSFGF
jgi:hypothetical protein